MLIGPNAGQALDLYIHRLPPALLLTLAVTVAAVAMGLVIGLLLAFMRVSSIQPVAETARWIIIVGRATPLPPVLLLTYFAILSFGLKIEPWMSGAIGLGLNLGPYMAELFRSGIEAVPKGVIEAAEALGLSGLLVRRRVVIPIALRIMLPAIGQLTVGTLLNSAFVSQVATRDITGMSRNIINDLASPELWFVVAFTYFAIAFPLSRGLSFLERRMMVIS